MTGLVNVARKGDQMVSYFAKMLRVRVELQFSDLLVRPSTIFFSPYRGCLEEIAFGARTVVRIYCI